MGQESEKIIYFFKNYTFFHLGLYDAKGHQHGDLETVLLEPN